MSTPLEGILKERISSEGPLRFDVYMEQCLYHPEHGYYSHPGRIGRGGHYLTSPELDPAFGALWVRAIERVWQLCGEPGSFAVVEIGPGEGGFAASIAASATGGFAGALDLHLVERFPAMQHRQRERMTRVSATWHETIPVGIECGFVFANEVLDNQPIRVVQDDRELHVDLKDEHLIEAWLPLSGDAPSLHPEFVWNVARAIDRGAVVFIDYGYEGQPERTLAAYGAAGATTDVLTDPGERDITSHVDWAVVERALAAEGYSTAPVVTQQAALHALGLADLDTALRSQHRTSLASGDGAGAVRALSRRGALAALTDPSGLGRLRVLQAWRDIEGPVLPV